MRAVLSVPAAWADYPALSPDVIENSVTVVTKIHAFDHLIFDPVEVFFVHKTFLEQYDFLGGISFRMDAAGHAEADFFDHRERLDCYLDDVRQRVQQGTLPPPLAPLPAAAPALPADPAGGARVPHSCAACAHYDTQTTLKSVFAFDHASPHRSPAAIAAAASDALQTSTDDARDDDHDDDGAVTYVHRFADARRVLRVTVRPVAARLASEHLPFVTVNRWAVDGNPLGPRDAAAFRHLVLRGRAPPRHLH
nr:hypothetical protein HK105_003846 [Polyrhizophydium stewartii]